MKKTIATISISMMIILIVIVICGCHPQSYAPIPTYLDQDLGAIAAGPDGNVWFTEPYANEIGKISPINYAITAYQVPPAYASTYGIALGSDGNLWFMEQSGNKLVKYLRQVTPLYIPFQEIQILIIFPLVLQLARITICGLLNPTEIKSAKYHPPIIRLKITLFLLQTPG